MRRGSFDTLTDKNKAHLHHFGPQNNRPSPLLQSASTSLPPSRHASPNVVPPDVIPSGDRLPPDIPANRKQQQHRPLSGLSSASSSTSCGGGGADSPDGGVTHESMAAESIDSVRQEASHSISQLGSAKEATLLNELLYMKKGWLMMQASSSSSSLASEADKETSWNKHWFVLRGASMKYYKDAAAEDEASAEGVIDLSCAETRVEEVEIGRNFGFGVQTPFGDYVLSAMTAGIRKNWIQSIYQCMQVASPTETTFSMKEDDGSERGDKSSQQHQQQQQLPPSQRVKKVAKLRPILPPDKSVDGITMRSGKGGGGGYHGVMSPTSKTAMAAASAADKRVSWHGLDSPRFSTSSSKSLKEEDAIDETAADAQQHHHHHQHSTTSPSSLETPEALDKLDGLTSHHAALKTPTSTLTPRAPSCRIKYRSRSRSKSPMTASSTAAELLMSGHHRHHPPPPPHHDDGYSASSTASSAGSMSPSGSSSVEAELSIIELLEAELRYVNQQLQKSHQQLLRQSELQLDNDEVDEDEESDPELLTSHMNLVDFISRTRQEIESRMTSLRPKMKEFKSRSELNRLQVSALKEKVKQLEDLEKKETEWERQVEELKNQIVDYQDDEEEMEKEMNSLEERLKEASGKALSLETEVGMRDAMLEEQKGELERLYLVEADYHETLDRVESLKESVEEYREREVVWEREKADLMEVNRETESKRDEEVGQLAMQNRHLEDKLQNVINEVNSKEIHDEEVRKIVEEKNEIISQLEERLMEEV